MQRAVALEIAEWNQVMAILSTAPWKDANPLLMKIGHQLNMQQEALQKNPPTDITPPSEGNGGQHVERH